MFNPPKQVPTSDESFVDWQDHSLPDKTSVFEYSDKTEDHIGPNDGGQKFHYGMDPLPEKI